MMKSMKSWGRCIPRFNTQLRLAENPAAQNMPHEEDYSDGNYESIDETAV